MATDDRNEKIMVCGVEITKAEWDEVKDYPNKLPRKVALHIIKEFDERKAEEQRKKRNIRPDKWEGPSIIIDPLRRTAVKVDQLMPKYLNYGSFCKIASQQILECVNWMRVIKDCAVRSKEAKTGIKPGMITQSIIDYFTHLKKESAFAMKQYKQKRFDMRVYIYIFNVINEYYEEKLKDNRYLVKNDIITEIFQDRKVEWYTNYRATNNVTFFQNECIEQDGYEEDFFNAIKKYNEICKVHDDIHFVPETGRETRCVTTGDIDIAFIPEYMNWFSRIKSKSDEETIKQFYFITRHYKKGFVKMKTWKDPQGKFKFKLWANTPYYKQYNYNNDNWDDEPVNDNVKSNINSIYSTDNSTNKTINNISYIEPIDTIGNLAKIYNSGYKEKVFCSYYNNACSYTCYVLSSSINSLSNNQYPQNFNVDNTLSNIIYSYYLDNNYNISYIDEQYLHDLSEHNTNEVNNDYTSYLCSHDSPPGDIESDKPPDGIKRYIFDRSIIV